MADPGRSSSRAPPSSQGWLAGGEPVLRPTSTIRPWQEGVDPPVTGLQEPIANVQARSSNDAPTSLARNSSMRATGVSSEPDVHAQADAAAAAPVSEEKVTPPERSKEGDSVSVFVHGAAVSIVVRDATLCAHEAVECAFETARQLTGQRNALLRLTLNGQTLYQQRTVGSHVEPALLFAC